MLLRYGTWIAACMSVSEIISKGHGAVLHVFHVDGRSAAAPRLPEPQTESSITLFMEFTHMTFLFCSAEFHNALEAFHQGCLAVKSQAEQWQRKAI